MKERQSETGIKDAYTQYWVDILIDRARVEQKSNPAVSTAVIQEELMKWVNGHKDAIYNSFLTLDGTPTKQVFCL